MWVEAAAKDIVGMACELFEDLALRDVPDYEGIVVRGGTEVLGVAGPGDVGDASGVFFEGSDEFAAVECVPYLLK